MKKRTLKAALAVFLAMIASVSLARAEIIPPYGEGQIGLQAVVLCETLTVRRAPAASSEAVTTLHYGDRIIVQPETGGWATCFLSDAVDEGPAGWVNEEYLAIDCAWYRTEERTPVYAWNDTMAPKVALLDADATLPILKQDGDWLIVSLRGATGWVHCPNGAEAAETEGRQDGERFEATLLLEGMEETVRYEHAVNDAIGIEMDYDYECFERRSEADREVFVSRYDDPDDPLNTLEVCYRAEDAEAAAEAVGAALSEAYDIVVEPLTLEGAGSCTRIDASAVRGRNEMPELIQEVYVIPAGDGCVVATARMTIESAEGFGTRIGYMMDTLAVTGRRAE